MALNNDCLFHILKHCSPETVVRFSRTNWSVNRLIKKYGRSLPCLNAVISVSKNTMDSAVNYQLTTVSETGEKQELINKTVEFFDFAETKKTLCNVNIKKIIITINDNRFQQRYAKELIKNLQVTLAELTEFIWKGDRGVFLYAKNCTPQQLVELVELYCENLDMASNRDITNRLQEYTISKLLHYIFLKKNVTLILKDLLYDMKNVGRLIQTIIKTIKEKPDFLSDFCISFKIFSLQDLGIEFDALINALRIFTKVETVWNQPWLRVDQISLLEQHRTLYLQLHTDSLNIVLSQGNF